MESKKITKFLILFILFYILIYNYGFSLTTGSALVTKVRQYIGRSYSEGSPPNNWYPVK